MANLDDFGVLIAHDPLELADLVRKERKEAIHCGVCGNPEPVRVERAGCNACVAFPACWMCGRWTDTPDAPPSQVMSVDGALVTICDCCMERVE